MGGERWIDAEAAGRSLGVCGLTVRRWCKDGLVSVWRTIGLGAIRRYQISADALEELRARHVQRGESYKPNKSNTD